MGQLFVVFGLQEVLTGLVGIYSSTKTENVKATAASTLSRLLRSNLGMMTALMERWGCHLLLTGEGHGLGACKCFSCSPRTLYEGATPCSIACCTTNLVLQETVLYSVVFMSRYMEHAA